MAISFVLATSLVPVVPAVAASSDSEIESNEDGVLLEGLSLDGGDSATGTAESSDVTDVVVDESITDDGLLGEAPLLGGAVYDGSGFTTVTASFVSLYSSNTTDGEAVATRAATSTAPNTFTDEYGTWTIQTLTDGSIRVSKFVGNSAEALVEVFEFPTTVPCDVSLSDGTVIAKGTPISSYANFAKKTFTGINAKEIVLPGGFTYAGSLTANCETLTVKSGAKGSPTLKLTGLQSVKVESGAQTPKVQNNTTLKEVNIEDGAIVQGDLLFSKCTALETARVSAVAGNMFQGCTSLETVEFTSDVTKIDDYAFDGCSKLSSIDLSNITSIGTYAFSRTSLSDISIATNCNVARAAFAWMSSSPSVYYDGASMGDSCFVDVDVKELRLGANAKGIDRAAFVSSSDESAQTARLQVDINNDTYYLSADHKSLFGRSDDGATRIYPYQRIENVPDTIKNVPASTTEWTVGKDIKVIVSGAFNSHPRLASISIEEGNTSFVLDYQGALYTADMKTLIKVPADAASFVVPDGVTTIEQNAFCCCDKLTSVTLPESLTEIKTEAFWGCSSLASIKFPKSLTTVGVGILEGTALEKLQISEGLWSNSTKDDFVQDGAVPSIETLFYGMNWGATNWNIDSLNKSLTSLDLSLYKPSFIPAYAFAGLLGLTEVSIPSSVTNIGYGAFYYCLNLKDVYVYAPTGMKIESGGMSDGNSGSGNADESYKVSNPGSFSTWDESLDPAPFTSAKYADLTGINFYGAAYSQNDVISYCAEHGQNFIPIAVLQDNSSVFGDYTVSYGTGAYDYDHVEIANIPVGGTPSVNIVFGDYGTPRTLKNGDGCSIYYVDSEGNVVTSFDKAGTYTAFISGDNKSVFGQRAVSFQVGDTEQPVQSAQSAQTVSTVPAQQQSAAVATGQTFATTNDATDVAPVAAVGLAGAFAAVGAWFARRRLKNEQ